MDPDFISQDKCCDVMFENVIQKQGWYENDDMAIITGKNKNPKKLLFIYLDKKKKQVQELKNCIWCHRELNISVPQY